MASKQLSDADIREELAKLKYSDIPEELFQKLKEELNRAMSSDESENSPDGSVRTVSSEMSSSLNSQSTSTSFRYDSALYRSSSDSFVNSTQKSSYDYNRGKENRMSSESSFLSPRIVKRKVLRHINGEPVIEEGIRIVPSTVNNAKAEWNDDVRPSSSSKPSQFEEIFMRMRGLSLENSSKSSSSKSSVLLPNFNVARRKHDPVTRYHQYKKYWDTFKPPGENKHNSLRWTVREKMLDYDFS